MSRRVGYLFPHGFYDVCTYVCPQLPPELTAEGAAPAVSLTPHLARYYELVDILLPLLRCAQTFGPFFVDGISKPSRPGGR